MKTWVFEDVPKERMMMFLDMGLAQKQPDKREHGTPESDKKYVCF